MATAEVQINALSVETYQSSKNCGVCYEQRPPGFSWMVVTCGCGCGEKKRSCQDCPAGTPPKCNGIKYKILDTVDF